MLRKQCYQSYLVHCALQRFQGRDVCILCALQAFMFLFNTKNTKWRNFLCLEQKQCLYTKEKSSYKRQLETLVWNNEASLVYKSSHASHHLRGWKESRLACFLDLKMSNCHVYICKVHLFFVHCPWAHIHFLLKTIDVLLFFFALSTFEFGWDKSIICV